VEPGVRRWALVGRAPALKPDAEAVTLIGTPPGTASEAA
jgi:hypothetical protein